MSYPSTNCKRADIVFECGCCGTDVQADLSNFQVEEVKGLQHTSTSYYIAGHCLECDAERTLDLGDPTLLYSRY